MPGTLALSNCDVNKQSRKKGSLTEIVALLMDSRSAQLLDLIFPLKQKGLQSGGVIGR